MLGKQESETPEERGLAQGLLRSGQPKGQLCLEQLWYCKTGTLVCESPPGSLLASW